MRPYQGAKNSTRIKGSLFTTETKLEGVKLITSDASSAETRPTAANRAAHETNCDRRMLMETSSTLAGKSCLRRSSRAFGGDAVGLNNVCDTRRRVLRATCHLLL